MNTHNKKKTPEEIEEEKYPLPVYDSKDDIYKQEKEVSLDELDKAEEPEMKNSKSLGSDLDVPGSELDDENEAIGEEDEENNFYSLGGDNHDDLEEENTDLVDED